MLSNFDKPFVTAFSGNDPVTRGGDLQFQTLIPSATGQAQVMLKGGHFLQEDSPDDIVAVIVGTLKNSRT